MYSSARGLGCTSTLQPKQTGMSVPPKDKLISLRSPDVDRHIRRRFIRHAVALAVLLLEVEEEHIAARAAGQTVGRKHAAVGSRRVDAFGSVEASRAAVLDVVEAHRERLVGAAPFLGDAAEVFRVAVVDGLAGA